MVALDIVNKKNIILTNRGNKSIEYAYKLCKGKGLSRVLIQKVGGWMTYDRLASKLGLEFDYVNTNDSLVDLDDLRAKISKYDVFIFNRVPGYFCYNDVDEIRKICANKIIIEDQCGELSSTDSDIVIGSFGRWKPLNLGHGGFLATDFDINIETNLTHENLESEIKPILDAYEERVFYLKEIASKIKDDLKEFDVINKDHKGINVVVAFESENVKQKIISYCDSNDLEYEICPRDIRIDRDAVSIEVKRK